MNKLKSFFSFFSEKEYLYSYIEAGKLDKVK